MKPLILNAMTDFILACEVFYFAGKFSEMPKTQFSSAWWWNIAIIFLGTTTLLGGIVHGFFETNNIPFGIYLKKANWFLLGVLTFTILMTVTTQFLPNRLNKLFIFIGITQLAIFTLFLILKDNFIIVILNNIPALILLLILNIIGLSSGEGSINMVLGIIILIIAALVQAFKFNLFYPLDGNGLGHIILMIGVIFLFSGGLSLNRFLTP